MTSAASRLVGEPGAGATTFSYAQAAKGRAAPTTVSTAQISQHTSGTDTPPRTSNSMINTISSSVNDAENPDIDRGVNKGGEVDLKATSTSSEAESKVVVTTAPGSSPSSPSLATTSNSNLPEEEHLVNANPTSNSSWGKQTQDETPVDKPIDGMERKKGRKSKKDKSPEKEADTEKEELKIEVLVAAPPPAVNIWQQRIEAQAAKAKSSPQALESPQFPIGDSNVISAISPMVKPLDPRKKGKLSGAEESDRPTYSSQNGGVKDQQSFTKPQRKGSEGNAGSKEEFSGKRSTRGGRIGEKEEKSIASQLPPPVEDATLWPTPETALEEERRKAQEKLEKEEKDESVPNKPRPKEKWVPVPYIPTVTFSTPLPSRGGRARGGARGRDGGGRGGHASNSSVSGEKTTNSTVVANSPGTETRERGRDTNNSGRATSLPPIASKRPAGETHFPTHDQRKPTIQNLEKHRHEYPGLPNKTKSPTRDRRSSIATQTELSSSVHQELQQSGIEVTRSGGSGPQNGTNAESHPQAKSERRIDSTIRVNDTKEASVYTQTRDRGDGRLERGRGGFRGRGAHGGFANGQQTFTNGHSTQQNGYSTARQNAGPYSPPLQQGQYPATYQANPNRGRAGPRSQSIPTSSAIYTRYPNVPVTAQQIPPLQTAGPLFEYAGIQTMSSTSYNPYVEQYSVLSMVTMQLEYYFSIDNLCKDVYLRKHMDSQGFVFLAFIAKFRRIQSLTLEFDLLRFACQESEIIDIVTGDDGIDRIRRLDGWEKWVLAMEERDDTAKNAGPERYTRLQIHTRHQPLVPRMIAQPHPVMSPTVIAPNSAESGYRTYTTLPTSLDATEHPMAYITESPLSAAVPDFAPSPATNEMSELEAETTFTDEEVDNLQLVYNRKSQGDTKPKAPGHGPSSRTFSNGSIDGRPIHEDLLDLEKHQGRTLVNGGSPTSEISPDRLNRPRSPFKMSPTRLAFGNAPPVMWVKGQKDQAPVTEENKNEPYNTIRARALRHRETSPPSETDNDMKLLYEFWSHFLVRNFNPRMYEEFRKCAIDDYQNRQNMFGMTNLIQYYDEVLKSKKKVIPDVLAKHYVEVVKGEDPSRERIAFAKLRAAWRNGAVEMKSRKKIGNLVDHELREELER